MDAVTLPPVLTVEDLVRRGLARAVDQAGGARHIITDEGQRLLRENQESRTAYFAAHPDEREDVFRAHLRRKGA